MEGPHAIIGAEVAKKHHESSIVVNAIAAHHGDEEFESIEANISSGCRCYFSCTTWSKKRNFRSLY